MLKLVRFAPSTNVERVALALARKRLAVESIVVDPDDRSPVRAHVLHDHMRLDGHPRVAAWIERVGERPMA